LSRISDADSDSKRNSNTHRDANGYGNAYGHSHGNCYGHSHSYADCDGNFDSDCDRNANRDCNCNPNRHSYRNVHSDTDGDARWMRSRTRLLEKACAVAGESVAAWQPHV
jgi:hypothetical protein